MCLLSNLKHFTERLQLVGKANTGQVLQCPLVVGLHSKEEVDREDLKNSDRQNDLGHCQEKRLQHLEYKALRTRLQEDTVHKTKGIVRASKKILSLKLLCSCVGSRRHWLSGDIFGLLASPWKRAGMFLRHIVLTKVQPSQRSAVLQKWAAEKFSRTSIPNYFVFLLINVFPNNITTSESILQTLRLAESKFGRLSSFNRCSSFRSQKNTGREPYFKPLLGSNTFKTQRKSQTPKCKGCLGTNSKVLMKLLPSRLKQFNKFLLTDVSSSHKHQANNTQSLKKLTNVQHCLWPSAQEPLTLFLCFSHELCVFKDFPSLLLLQPS